MNTTKEPPAAPAPTAPAAPTAPTAPDPARAALVDPLLQAVGVVTVISALFGLLVLPGLLGNVGERAVVWGERLTSTFSYAALGGLLGLIGLGGYELIRRTDLGGVRFAALGSSVLVVGLAAPAATHPLIAIPQVMLAVAAGLFALITATRAARSIHTRAPAGVLALLGLSGLLRTFAWAVAAVSLTNPARFSFARGLGTAAVVCLGLAHLVAVAYFATRGRLQGRVFGNGALVLGFVVTYIAARKPAGLGAAGAVLHSALSVGAASPEPFGLAPVAYYLFPTGLALALVAVAQRRQVPAVAVGLGLVLASQSRFDVPLAALSVVAGGMWLALAATDGRALWTDLITTRRQRLVDEAGSDAQSSRPRPGAGRAR